jgi:hypothetical protein
LRERPPLARLDRRSVKPERSGFHPIEPTRVAPVNGR